MYHLDEKYHCGVTEIGVQQHCCAVANCASIFLVNCHTTMHQVAFFIRPNYDNF